MVAKLPCEINVCTIPIVVLAVVYPFLSGLLLLSAGLWHF